MMKRTKPSTITDVAYKVVSGYHTMEGRYTEVNVIFEGFIQLSIVVDSTEVVSIASMEIMTELQQACFHALTPFIHQNINAILTEANNITDGIYK